VRDLVRGHEVGRVDALGVAAVVGQEADRFRIGHQGRVALREGGGPRELDDAQPAVRIGTQAFAEELAAVGQGAGDGGEVVGVGGVVPDLVVFVGRAARKRPGEDRERAHGVLRAVEEALALAVARLLDELARAQH
jgi:hypothetical protein